jgi:hypothetical protein
VVTGVPKDLSSCIMKNNVECAIVKERSVSTAIKNTVTVTNVVAVTTTADRKV